MTQRRELATAIARKIFDRIERDKTLILQNVADEIHDALVLEDAKQPKVIVSVDPASPAGDREAIFTRNRRSALEAMERYKYLKNRWDEEAQKVTLREPWAT